MNDSTPATLAQSKVFTNKSYKSIATKSKRNINSYVQNFTREFVMKRVSKRRGIFVAVKCLQEILSTAVRNSNVTTRQQRAVLDLMFCRFFHAVMYRSPATSSE